MVPKSKQVFFYHFADAGLGILQSTVTGANGKGKFEACNISDCLHRASTKYFIQQD